MIRPLETVKQKKKNYFLLINQKTKAFVKVCVVDGKEFRIDILDTIGHEEFAGLRSKKIFIFLFYLFLFLFYFIFYFYFLFFVFLFYLFYF